MVTTIAKYLSFIITPLSGYFVIKNILQIKNKYITFKIILLLILLSVANLLLYKIEYASYITIFTLLISLFIYKVIFKQSMYESIITTTIFFILLVTSDILSLIILPIFIPVNAIRNNSIVMCFSNFLVGIISIILSKIRFINLNAYKFAKVHNNSKIKTIVIYLFYIITIIFLVYILGKNYKFISNNFIIFLIMLLIFVLFLFFLQESNNRKTLEIKYNEILDYSKNFEDIIDRDRMIVHEHKNQLAAIKLMKNKKEIQNYIDSIIKFDDKDNYNSINNINLIPKGGLKGIIYYKIIMAQNKKLNFIVDISSSLKKELYLEDKTINNLVQILGIVLDNALEAAECSDKKSISLEVYKINSTIKFVVTNSFYNPNLVVSKMNEKGYSTKGEKRGNGLYFVEKIIRNDNKITTNKKIINNYFIYEIIINKKGD